MDGAGRAPASRLNDLARPHPGLGMNGQMERTRAAQAAWADRPVPERLAVIARLRRLCARDPQALAATAMRPNMNEADILVAEVMPLLAACRFLERQAPRLLAPRRPDGQRPIWLAGAQLQVRRLPLGIVLIIAPRNYPLLLAGVQAIQALTAGNGVVVKPAPGFAAPMQALGDALLRAGLPDGLFAVLADTHEAGEQALALGADKVVLTGGEATGRRVLARLAETLTPATLELSGDDAVIVLPGAPIETMARVIAHGLRLNGGETCIAPRRIIAVGEIVGPLAGALADILPTLPPCHVPAPEAERIADAVTAAEAAGAAVIGGRPGETMQPLVLRAASPEQALPPLFGPAATLITAPDAETAITIANASRFALGASVFGPPREAMDVARRLRAGSVTVNDLIVSTADPRLPFGGTGASGFGVTRGAEGLLDMTRPQAIVSRRRILAAPFRVIPPGAARWIARGLRLLYG
ncbi:MAG: aldehyde dehydrogenase family protein [Acetobacteraceae bacterium]